MTRVSLFSTKDALFTLINYERAPDVITFVLGSVAFTSGAEAKLPMIGNSITTLEFYFLLS